VDKIIAYKKLKLMITFKNILKENNKRKYYGKNKRRSRQRLTQQRISLSLMNKNISLGV
jgi:hypothetical protein